MNKIVVFMSILTISLAANSKTKLSKVASCQEFSHFEFGSADSKETRASMLKDIKRLSAHLFTSGNKDNKGKAQSIEDEQIKAEYPDFDFEYEGRVAVDVRVYPKKHSEKSISCKLIYTKSNDGSCNLVGNPNYPSPEEKKVYAKYFEELNKQQNSTKYRAWKILGFSEKKIKIGYLENEHFSKCWKTKDRTMTLQEAVDRNLLDPTRINPTLLDNNHSSSYSGNSARR